MKLDQLFSFTVQDLMQRLEVAENDYTILRMSGLVRQLIADHSPLAPRVAKEYGYELSYSVSVPGGNSLQDVISDWAFTSESVLPMPGEPSEEIGHEQFLARVIVTVNGEDFTVRNLVRVIANLHGGIHHADARDEAEARLSAADRFTVNDITILNHAMRDVARVTAIACFRLVRHMRSQTQQPLDQI